MSTFVRAAIAFPSRDQREWFKRCLQPLFLVGPNDLASNAASMNTCDILMDMPQPPARFSRRTLLEIAPTVAALIATEAGIVTTASAQGRGQEGPQRVTKEQLKDSLDILGLDFTDEQRAMMLPAVNRALTGYEGLRKLNIPLDTEPAFHFRPSLPGKEPKPRASHFAPTHSAKLATFKNIEDLAFSPVTELAPLVRAKKISST